MKKLLLTFFILFSLFATTVAYADYTGPNRQGGEPPATADGSLVCSVPGSSGWCRNGYLKFTANEPVDGYVISAIETDLWGYVCQPNTASPTCTYNPGDGAGAVTFWAESTYGDSSTQHTLSWKIDTTAPTLTPSVPTPDGQNGWFISNPTVDASGSDATSGVAAVQCRVDGEPWQSPPITIVGEGGRVVECRVVDNAGNMATWLGTVKIDTTPPTANPVVSGTLGSNGWYVSPVTAKANAADNVSGVGNVEHQIDGGAWVTGDSVTLHDGIHTVVFRVTDNAGNMITTAPQTVKVDTTAPTLTPSVPTPDGQNGWFISNPTVDASGSDATSGLAWLVCRVDRGDWQAPPVLVTGDGVHAVACQAVDNAGNDTMWPETVKVDTTAPTLTLSVPTPDGQNGWFVSFPTVVAHAVDTTSGVAKVEHQIDGGAWQSGDSVTLSDGVHTVAFRVADNAGNVTTTAPQTVKVDTTPPTLTPSAPTPDGKNGWFITSPVSVEATASDATSGIASLVCNVDGRPWQSPPVTVTGDGTHTVDCQAQDNAGNTAAWSGTVKVDTTAPTANPATSGTMGNNGWYISTVTVQANASDAASGVARVEHKVDGGKWQDGDSATLGDGAHTVVFRVADNAGNTFTTAAQTVKVDAAAPVANPATSGMMGNNGWYTSVATVRANALDATSGVAQVKHQVDGGAWQDGGRVTLGDGVHTVAFRVADNAGNVTTTPAQTVKVDATAPVLTPSAPTPDGQNGWFVTEPQVDARGSDATSGLASVQCRVDGGKWQSPPVLVIGDGVHAVDCQAQDNAGNTAAWSGTVKVDTTAPVSAFETPAEGATVWGIVTLHGVSDDPTSGLANVEVSTDNGATWKPATLVASTSQWTAFWDTRPLPDGTYTLMARAQDEAGNEEHTAIVHVTVANAPPQVSLHPGRWYSWQTAQANITPNPYIPLKSVTVSVLGPAGYVRRWHYGAVQHVDIHWNARWYSENGEWAHPGKYRVVVEAVDIYGHSGSAKGVVIVPQPAPTATPTPTATLTPTSTATATATPAPTATILIPTAMPTQPLATSQPTAVHMIAPTPLPKVKSGKNSLAKAVPMGVVSGILALLAGALIADPRPKPTRELANTLNQINRYLEHKKEE